MTDTLPHWVNWKAQDKDGSWWGFEHEPNQHYQGWYENELGRYVLINKEPPNLNWRTTLQKVDS